MALENQSAVLGVIQDRIQKTCRICGKLFYVIPYRENKAKYCSNKCRYKSQIKLVCLKCAVCGKTISLPPNRLRGKNFCSLRCRVLASKTRPLLTCPVCKKTFKAHYSDRKTGEHLRQKYCSRKCMAIAYSHKLVVTCEACGKRFSVPPSSKDRRFCSVDCSTIIWSETIKEQYRTGKRKEGLVINQFWASKRADLNNQFFRSSWEANIARFLNFLDIKWIYEPERIPLANGTTYLPDFFLPDLQCYFEVKGWFKNVQWQEKVKLFSRSHDIVVIDKQLYLAIERCFGKIVSNWEKYQCKKKTARF